MPAAATPAQFCSRHFAHVDAFGDQAFGGKAEVQHIAGVFAETEQDAATAAIAAERKAALAKREAEEKELAAERARIEADKAALAAQQKAAADAEAARLAAIKKADEETARKNFKPTAQNITEVVASHYKVSFDRAATWIEAAFMPSAV